MAKPAAPFVLAPSDQATVQRWSRMGSFGQRAKMLLLLAYGLTPYSQRVYLQYDIRFLSLNKNGDFLYCTQSQYVSLLCK